MTQPDKKQPWHSPVDIKNLWMYLPAFMDHPEIFREDEISVLYSPGIIQISPGCFMPVKDTVDLSIIQSENYIPIDSVGGLLNLKHESDAAHMNLDSENYHFIDDDQRIDEKEGILYQPLQYKLAAY